MLPEVTELWSVGFSNSVNSVKTVGTWRFLSSEIHIDMGNTYHSPALDKTLFPSLLMALFRLTDTIVNIGNIFSALYLNCDKVSERTGRQLLTNTDIRIAGKLYSDHPRGGIL